jgi:hypothetical protein
MGTNSQIVTLGFVVMGLIMGILVIVNIFTGGQTPAPAYSGRSISERTSNRRNPTRANAGRRAGEEDAEIEI